jgi:hypothetical protein
VTPKRKKVRIEIEGIEETVCKEIGGKTEEGKCVIETEGEEKGETHERAEGEAEQR